MTRSGKVVLVSNNFPPVRGGSAVVYDNLARCSQDRIIVIAPRVSYVDGLPIIGWREHDRRAPYRVIRLKLLRTLLRSEQESGDLRKLFFVLADLLIRLRLAFTLIRLIVRERVSAVCIGELLASGWIFTLLRFTPGVRRLVYVHGEEITTQDPYDPSLRRRRRTLLSADRIIVVSRFTLQAVRSVLGGKAGDRISLIENGVDAARFVSLAKRPDLRTLYRLGEHFVYVSVCRLLEKKGIDNAILAFARVVASEPGSRYVIVGTGPFEDRLREIARDAGVADKVVFVGQVAEDELVEHYCLGDVFVMPNRELPNGDTEGFGLVFLEANSCGLPVIAGRDGGSTNAVRDGENGLVVDGTSIDEIATAMIRLRQDADLRARLRDRGRGIAASASWKEKTETFLRLCVEPAV